MTDRDRGISSAFRTAAVAGCLLLAVLWSMAATTAKAAEAPKKGGTVVASLGADPAVLNPDVSVCVPDIFVGCMLYDALVRFGEGFKIVPALAKSWEISPDGLVYTFHLVHASWQDGKPLTSADVKYTLLNVSAKYGAKFAAAGQVLDSIDDSDPETAVIKLAKPFGPFLFSLACEQNAAILPAHIFQGQDVLKSEATLSKPVGIGPFKLAEWVRGDHLTVARNPDYWRKGEPYLDRIVVKVMPDSATRLLALQAGEIDFVDEYYFPLSSYGSLKKDPRFQLEEVSYPSDDLIILNTKRPPLDNPKVRQALLVAIDRDYIHKNVFYGIGSIARSSIDTRIDWAYNPKVDYEKMYAYDPARAKALLDEAGVKPGADGTRFTLSLLFDTGRPEYIQWAQALQRYWQAVGIKVSLDGAERPVILKRVYSDYDFGATLQNYTTAADPALGVSRIYVTDSIKQGQTFNNASRYSNPEVDALFDKGRDAATREERAKYYREAQVILARDLPTLTIHQQAEIDAASARLQDLWKAANYLWWGSVWVKE